MACADYGKNGRLWSDSGVIRWGLWPLRPEFFGPHSLAMLIAMRSMIGANTASLLTHQPTTSARILASVLPLVCVLAVAAVDKKSVMITNSSFAMCCIAPLSYVAALVLIDHIP